MRSWLLLPCLTGFFGILIPWGLAARWDQSLAGLLRAPTVSPGLVKFVWHCAAAALIPAFGVCLAMALIFRRPKRPTGKVSAMLVALAFLAAGIWGGVLPLWKMDQIQMLCRRE